MLLILMKNFITFFNQVKIIFYLKVFLTFALFSILITYVIVKVVPFLLIIMHLVIFFAVQTTIIGNNYELVGGYKEISNFARRFILTLKNDLEKFSALAIANL